MNYDKAHALAKELRESEEFKTLAAVEKRVRQEESTLKMVKEFISLQVRYEYSKMAEAEDTASLEEQIKALSPIGAQNQLASEFLMAYSRWSQVSQEVYQIVAQPITEGMSILEDETVA